MSTNTWKRKELKQRKSTWPPPPTSVRLRITKNPKLYKSQSQQWQWSQGPSFLLYQPLVIFRRTCWTTNLRGMSTCSRYSICVTLATYPRASLQRVRIMCCLMCWATNQFTETTSSATHTWVRNRRYLKQIFPWDCRHSLKTKRSRTSLMSSSSRTWIRRGGWKWNWRSPRKSSWRRKSWASPKCTIYSRKVQAKKALNISNTKMNIVNLLSKLRLLIKTTLLKPVTLKVKFLKMKSKWQLFINRINSIARP